MLNAVVTALSNWAPISAQATGIADDGPAGIGVIGSGLKERGVRITLDGWKAGAKARVSEWSSTEYVGPVRSWKAMSSQEFRGHKFETAIWKIDKNVPHGHSICAEVAGYEERMPCVTTKR